MQQGKRPIAPRQHEIRGMIVALSIAARVSFAQG
jgi:hypothetical protein